MKKDQEVLEKLISNYEVKLQGYREYFQRVYQERVQALNTQYTSEIRQIYSDRLKSIIAKFPRPNIRIEALKKIFKRIE